jgi:hypothetical protein
VTGRADLHRRFEQVKAQSLERAAREEAAALARLRGRGAPPRGRHGEALRLSMRTGLDAQRRRRRPATP